MHETHSQNIDNRDGHHARITHLETFGSASKLHWAQFGGGRVLRARSWRVLRILSPLILCRLVNHVEMDSALRLERGGIFWRATGTGKDAPRGDAILVCSGVHRREAKPRRLDGEGTDKNDILQHCTRLSVHERTEPMTNTHHA